MLEGRPWRARVQGSTGLDPTPQPWSWAERLMGTLLKGRTKSWRRVGGHDDPVTDTPATQRHPTSLGISTTRHRVNPQITESVRS